MWVWRAGCRVAWVPPPLQRGGVLRCSSGLRRAGSHHSRGLDSTPRCSWVVAWLRPRSASPLGWRCFLRGGPCWPWAAVSVHGGLLLRGRLGFCAGAACHWAGYQRGLYVLLVRRQGWPLLLLLWHHSLRGRCGRWVKLWLDFSPSQVKLQCWHRRLPVVLLVRRCRFRWWVGRCLLSLWLPTGGVCPWAAVVCLPCVLPGVLHCRCRCFAGGGPPCGVLGLTVAVRTCQFTVASHRRLSPRITALSAVYFCSTGLPEHWAKGRRFMVTCNVRLLQTALS